MKKSRLYLAGTVAGLCLFLLLTIVSTRFTTTDRPAYIPERTEGVELTRLANFTHITARGDFILEIQQQASFTVDYDPQTPYGAFKAEVIGNELRLEGFGNTGTGGSSVVRVGLPVLDALTLESLKLASVSGFSAEQLSLSASYIETVRLENNNIGTLSISADGVRNLELQANVIGVRQFKLSSMMTLLTEQN